MYQPTTRLLTVLELLQVRGAIDGAELAERLEVDRRSVRRYVTMLQDLGIPVEGVRGSGGGYRLRPGFKMPPLMFTDDEVVAVVLGLMSARTQGIQVDPAVTEGALAKIERVLPEALKARVQALRGTITVAAKPKPKTPQTLLGRLSLAISERRRVHITYTAWASDATSRVVDPYGIVAFQSSWYVVGHCHLRGSLRTFRLDRIERSRLREDTFLRPVDFDAEHYLVTQFATNLGRWPVDVVLETDLETAADRVPRGYAILQPAEGGVSFRCSVDDLESFARYLVGLGFPFLVRGPAELAAAVSALGQELQAQPLTSSQTG